jgi:hypothetical protein
MTWGAGSKSALPRRITTVILTAIALAAVGVWHLDLTGTANAAGTQGTFGKTTVGASTDAFATGRKRVNMYALSRAGLVSKLDIYLQPTGVSGQQSIEGILYANSAGAPGALLGVSTELVYHSTEAAGWYELSFTTPLNLPAGNYWIGVITGSASDVAGYRYDSVTGSRDYNTNAYASGPSNPFGSPTVDAEQMSIYATYTSTGQAPPPTEIAAPTVSGVAETGQRLRASSGTWTESPGHYTYQWERCNSTGSGCSAILGSTESTYISGLLDVGSTLRVAVVAIGEGGESTPASSASTPVETSSTGSHHLEYVLQDGTIYVYDMDHGYGQVGTIALPQTSTGVRGVDVYPPSHMMYISYGGDGGTEGNGSVLAYNLVSDEVAGTVHLETGIDSGALSPDGTLLYMPTGEMNNGYVWNVLDTSNGAIVGKIEGGLAPHNTIASKDGRFVYLGGRYSNYLDVYETETGKVRDIGPLMEGVRPFTVNGSNTLAFTTATGFDGFQVSSITTGKALFTTSFGAVPPELPDSAPSHGISLSPNEKELYVVDDVNKEIQVYNVAHVAEGVAPTFLDAIPVAGLEGTATPCAYDCGRGGWLQRSTDGRFVFVGDSGSVIETATWKVIANLPTLLNTKISIEVDWENGLPTATSGRTGVGEVG